MPRCKKYKVAPAKHIFKVRNHKPREKTRIEKLADIIMQDMVERGCVMVNPKSSDVVYSANYLLHKSLLAPVFQAIGMTKPKHIGRAFYQSSLRCRSLFFKHVMMCYYHHYVDPAGYNNHNRKPGWYGNFKATSAREMIYTCWRKYSRLRWQLWDNAKQLDPETKDRIIDEHIDDKVRAITDFNGTLEQFNSTMGRNMLPHLYMFAVLWHRWQDEPEAVERIERDKKILLYALVNDYYMRGLLRYVYCEHLQGIAKPDVLAKWTEEKDAACKKLLGYTLQEFEVKADARFAEKEALLHRMSEWELMDDIPQEFHDAISKALEPPPVVEEDAEVQTTPEAVPEAPRRGIVRLPRIEMFMTKPRTTSSRVPVMAFYQYTLEPRTRILRGPPQMRGSPRYPPTTITNTITNQ